MKMLFVVIINSEEHCSNVIKAMNAYGAVGSVIPTSSLRNAILHASTEPIPMFGGLRHLSENNLELNNTILTVINEEDLEATKLLVRSLSVEGTKNDGLMFAIPIVGVEEFTN